MPDPAERPAPLDHDAILLQRARVLEQLAGSAWHELAQPLGGLRGFVTMLQMEGWTREQLGIDPSLVEEAALTAERLARALTDLARGSTRPASVHDIVAGTLALAGYQLVDVAIANDVSAEAPEVDVDAAALRLVVASLIAGSVTALGGPRGARGRMRWTIRQAGDAHLDLVLEDSGAPGAPAGLALLDAMLATSGGSLRHLAPDEGGNRYVLGLPLARATGASDTPPAPGTAQGPRPEPLTVLVCDDDPVVRNLIVRLVQRAGMRALGVATGHDALDAMDRGAVDVVMTDYWMAGMSGSELHAAVCLRHPGLRHRFVLMSGDAGNLDLVAFAEAEGLTVLEKPFPSAALPETLREVATR